MQDWLGVDGSWPGGRAACKDGLCWPARVQPPGIDHTSVLLAALKSGKTDSGERRKKSSVNTLCTQEAVEPDFCYKDGNLEV